MNRPSEDISIEFHCCARPKALLQREGHTKWRWGERTVHPIFSRLAKRIYRHVAELSWASLAAIAILHFVGSWVALAVFEGGGIARPDVFWYFYATTATTVGYGDFAPATEAGRLVAVLWIMPGGIALFTSVIAKLVQFFADRGRKWMRGLGDYGDLEGHIVILGWHDPQTRRMVEYIFGDSRRENREIVLGATQDMNNPLPDTVKFVRAGGLAAPELLRRAGVAGADRVIVLGGDDNETLAAALGAGALNQKAHLVAFFEQGSLADILEAHCPNAECNVSFAIEMMVRSAQDPGSSRVQRQLLSTLEGPTQFSLRVPEGVAALDYGSVFGAMKERHDATLFGVARSELGEDLVLNAPKDHPIRPGDLLYFMSASRIRETEIDWAAFAA